MASQLEKQAREYQKHLVEKKGFDSITDYIHWCREQKGLPPTSKNEYTLNYPAERKKTIKSKQVEFEEYIEETAERDLEEDYEDNTFEKRDLIVTIMNRLTPRQRTFMIARFFQNKQVQKIAQEMPPEYKITPQGVSDSINKSLKKLRNFARKENYDMRIRGHI